MPTLEERAARIQLVCTDVDGVLTNGALHYGMGAGHTKNFHVRDGAGVKWLQAANIPVAFISGLASPATDLRARDLEIRDCFTGQLEKKPILEKLCAKYKLELDQIAHIGDDLHDLPLLLCVGLACCPDDAVPEVKAASHWTIPIRGGAGVFRAVAEMILKSQGRWEDVIRKYQN
jgi:3-deoxy-D-manno-octulosonate 8-phosphate phosphatase (KDO 8-P phosphatase)